MTARSDWRCRNRACSRPPLGYVQAGALYVETGCHVRVDQASTVWVGCPLCFRCRPWRPKPERGDGGRTEAA